MIFFSITKWVLPPTGPKTPLMVKNGSKGDDAWRKTTVNYVLGNPQLVCFMTVFVIVNLYLFAWRLWYYSAFKNSDGGPNFMFMFSRANGLCLDFNSMVVLTLVLRHTMTLLRKLGLASILPLDHHIWLHKVTGILIFCQAW